MGRDAVSFITGNITPEGDPLDGVSNGFVLIQPDVLKFNFDTDDDTFIFADIVSIAFKDNYDGSAFEGYAAEPAGALWTALIFDEFEFPVSCNPVPQDCFFDIGLNDVLVAANPLLDGDLLLCPGNDNFTGWVRINVSGLDVGEFENELGIVGIIGPYIETSGGATWMFVE